MKWSTSITSKYLNCSYNSSHNYPSAHCWTNTLSWCTGECGRTAHSRSSGRYRGRRTRRPPAHSATHSGATRGMNAGIMIVHGGLVLNSGLMSRVSSAKRTGSNAWSGHTRWKWTGMKKDTMIDVRLFSVRLIIVIRWRTKVLSLLWPMMAKISNRISRHLVKCHTLMSEPCSTLDSEVWCDARILNKSMVKQQ